MAQKSSTSINAIGAALGKAAEHKSNIVDVAPEAPEPKKLGRRKSITVNKKNCKSIYFTDEMMAQIEDVKYNSRVELQRTVQAAVHYFFKHCYDTQTKSLTREGLDEVREWEKIIEI